MRHTIHHLPAGSTIGLAAPSRYCTSEQVEHVTTFLKEHGYQVKVPEGLYERDGQLAGSDMHRAQLLHRLFEDRELSAILCMRGGYGAGRLLPHLRLPDDRREFPLLCGFSDVTALHAWCVSKGLQSLHSPVATTLLSSSPEAQQRFFECLSNADLALRAEVEAWNTGVAHGVIVGGNLSVLYSLRGTPWFPDLEGKILFLEDLDEMVYHLDRMLNNLALSGELQKVKALIIGGITEMRDNTIEDGFSLDNPFGYSPRQIFERYTKELTCPICWNFPAGHIENNMSIRMGQKATVEITENQVIITHDN